MKRILIVGGGVGGLAVGALLLRKGYDVTIIEKNNNVGGRASYLYVDGHGFDMGPTWYMMDDIYRNYFYELGVLPRYYRRLRALDPMFSIYINGMRIDVRQDVEDLASRLEEIEPGSGEKFISILNTSTGLYRLVVEKLLYRDYRRPWDMLTPSIFKIFRYIEPAQKMLNRLFKREEPKILLGYDSLFLGTPPWELPSLYLLLMIHSLFRGGVYYPQGGMSEVPRFLESYVIDKGGRILTGCEARKIEIMDGVVKSVKSTCGDHRADIVIANADYAHVELDLIEERYRGYDEEYWLSRKLAPSAFILYLGLKKELKDSHHIIVINSWEEHFHRIFRDPGLPNNPSYYIHNPLSLIGSDKPGIMILVPVAPGLRTNWADLYELLVRRVERDLGLRLEPSIKMIFTPQSFERRYNAFMGTALGLRHTFDQTAYYRPSIKSRKVNNLYFVGQYVHPGIGVPMVLASAQIVARAIENDLR
ncbi:MAG: phytoene desaturase family protein [Sulfolobales archaeon]